MHSKCISEGTMHLLVPTLGMRLGSGQSQVGLEGGCGASGPHP